eukprot:COSAG02_NODE_1344_length_13159_cov_10.788208_4_plen_759_part_00
MEELLEVPMCSPGSAVELKSRTGATITFSMPAVGSSNSPVEAPEPEPEPEPEQEQELEPLERAVGLKEEANQLFRAGEYNLAARAYLQATRVLRGAADVDSQSTCADVLCACWLNLAACRLRQQQPAGAVEACDRALAHRQSLKGLYRRALARKMLAADGARAVDTSSLALATTDAKAILKIDSTNEPAKRLLAELKQLRPVPRATDSGQTLTADKLPAITNFFDDDAVPVSLQWTQEYGRHLVAKRAIATGEIALAADAYVVISAQPSVPDNTSSQPQAMHEVCTKEDSLLTQAIQARLDQLQFSNDDDAELVSEVLLTADAIAKRQTSKHAGDHNIRQMELLGDKESLKLAAKILVKSAEDDPIRRATSLEDQDQATENLKDERGVHYALSFRDIADLVSHSEQLRRQPEAWAALTSSAQLLRRALGPAPAAAPADSVLGTLTTEAVVDLLLRIKYNAHPIHDAATHSKKVGLGVFPAACYINHGCSANVVYCHVNQGRTIVFRALRPIEAGEQVLYSYIDPYQTVEERRKLLRDAFLLGTDATANFERGTPSQAPQAAVKLGIGRPTDHLLSAGTSGTGLPAPDGAVQEVEERLQRGIRMMATDPQAAMRWLLQLAEDSCIRQLHAAHRLTFELALALLSTSSMVGACAAPVRVEWSIKAIQAMESVLDVGTPQLASLYASHAAGLMQMIRRQQTGQAHSEKRGLIAMGKQCIAALNAASAIRTVCYGDQDPLSISTQRAMANAKRELESIEMKC